MRMASADGISGQDVACLEAMQELTTISFLYYRGIDAAHIGHVLDRVTKIRASWERKTTGMQGFLRDSIFAEFVGLERLLKNKLAGEKHGKGMYVPSLPSCTIE